jgi:hypothetical protein
MKPFEEETDGRGAFLALKNHFLGPNNATNIASTTEAQMNALRYTGERRRYNFEAYVKGHTDCHNIFKDIMKYGYSGMDEATKVRRLIDGIYYPPLDQCRAIVIATPALLIDFQAVVVLYKDYIIRAKLHMKDPQAIQIGAIGSDHSARRLPSESHNWDTGDVKVDLRYHNRAEYAKLSGPQRLRLKEWRTGKSTQSRFPPGKTVRNPNDPLAKKMIAAMDRKRPANARKQQPRKKPSPSNGNRNRHNAALVRQVGATRAVRRSDDADEDTGDES